MIDVHYWTTPNGHKITMFLEETGLPYKIFPVRIGAGEQFKPSFLKISPNNRIPAIVDHDPPGGGAPISLFESGAILLYLAEKTGKFLAKDIRARTETLEWLFWQMANLGPMLGQNHHFKTYAPEKIPYAINRYVNETNRLYGVLNKRLAGREFIAGDYSIADMASYPWIVPHERQGQKLEDFPDLKRWFDAIRARPATVRAYEKAKAVNTEATMSDEAKKVLFGQTAASVAAAAPVIAMAMRLYDLAGADPNLRFSPYCWRAKFALAHKGLAVETIPWRFTEKNVIAFSGQERVPVLLDGDKAVHDSWAIACYLDDAYPDRPSLFGGASARAPTRFLNSWADMVLNPGIIRFVLGDIFRLIDPKDRDYFRTTREQRFGMSLEAFVAAREKHLPAFRQSLTPVRTTLAAQPYLAGERPAYADYIVFGSFQWPRCISPFALLEADDPIFAWRERMLDAFDGLGRKAMAA